jgi:hypothetical protein
MMDKVTLIYLLVTLFFILLGVLLNYPRKNKTGTGNDPGSTNTKTGKEVMNDE